MSAMAIVYPPVLMEPVRLGLLFAAVFAWLACVQHAHRKLRVSEPARPWINLSVVVGGPLLWGLVVFVRKLLASQSKLPDSLARFAAWLGVGDAFVHANDPSISVELMRSDGKPVSGKFGPVLKQAEAMNIARRMMHRALLLRAADVLIDPKAENDYQMRYRVDGLLRKPEWIDPEQALAVMNCFKILSDMDIAEKRRPQDGAFLTRQGKTDYKCRTATSSTVYGEKMAIRVLNQATDLLSMESLGMPEQHLVRVRRYLARPHGMMIVCGPTGSGKTTTLYGILGTLAKAGRNIITIEDPVEYVLPYASQTGVNTKAGITFATQLRHVLRQAPDVILVGEIRDEETARMALQASETGHLVFSTLHANDAVSGLIRLVDLGIEPYLVGAGLSCIVAQRLVRVLCTSCRQPARITPRLQREAANRGLDLNDVYRAGGCESCDYTGYRGRVGIFQMLDVTKEIGELLTRKPPLSELATLARKQGMATMRHDGIAKVLEGRTSVDEVVRVTVE